MSVESRKRKLRSEDDALEFKVKEKALRLRMKRYMKTTGTSITDISREISCALSTVYSFYHGKRKYESLAYEPLLTYMERHAPLESNEFSRSPPKHQTLSENILTDTELRVVKQLLHDTSPEVLSSAPTGSTTTNSSSSSRGVSSSLCTVVSSLEFSPAQTGPQDSTTETNKAKDSFVKQIN